MNKELEEAIKILKIYLSNSAYKEKDSDFFKNGGWEVVDLEIPQAIETVLQALENSIPKQVVKEKLEYIEDYFERLNGPDEDIEYIRDIKRELLEGNSMAKIKRIDLVFENCEICSLKPNMFKYLVIKNIKEEKLINCFQYEKRRNTNFS